MSYIDLKYEPTKDDLICKFFVEAPEGSTIEKACENIAAESSIGTWTDISTMEPGICEKLGPHVFSIKKETGEVLVAYPAELFEEGNMPEILSSVAGNIFGMNAVENLRLLDVVFPDSLRNSFKGPAFGIKGVRAILGVPERPLVGTIVKPKLGLPYQKHAKVAFESWVGGCDIVKDDENLTDQRFNPFRDRIIETLAMRDNAESETGEKKIYMPNISAETYEMLERADFVKENGGRYAMVDIVTVGFSGLQSVRDKNPGLVLHAHRAMHAAFTRNKKHGFSMLALAKIARLIGVDQIHIGTVVGKMEGAKAEVTEIRDAMVDGWGKIKPTFPVSSGGLHPGMVPALVGIMGNDIIIQAGGGVHGHPEGTRKGACALRQALDAAMEGISLEEYSKTHAELRGAIDKWGLV